MTKRGPVLGTDDSDRDRLEFLSGAEVIALTAADLGIERVFTYPGTSELSLCDAFERMPGVTVINSRGDREAAFMAAGANLMGPAKAVCLLHGARGLTNALGAIADVRRNEVPLLALVGMPSTASTPFEPPHGERDLILGGGHFSLATWEARLVPGDEEQRREAAAEFIDAIRSGFRTACGPPAGPFLLGLPQDVLEARWIPPEAISSPPPPESPSVPSDRDVTATADALAAARRPLLLVDDPLMRHPDAVKHLGELMTALGAPAFQVRYSRGPMLFERLPDHLHGFAGYYDPGNQLHRRAMAEADLLVTIEDRNMYERVVGRLPSCRKVAITSNAARTVKNGYLGPDDLLLSGKVAASLAAVSALVDDRDVADTAWRNEVLKLAEAPAPVSVGDDLAGSVRHRIARACGKALSPFAAPALVDDSQMLGGMLKACYDDLPRGLRVFGDHGGFVGAGLGYAVGLALSRPDEPVLCTLGDQALVNGVQALGIAGQVRSRLAVLVCNNGGAVSLRKQRDAGGARLGGAYLDNAANIDYAALGRAYGMPAAVFQFDLEGGVTGLDRAEARLTATLSNIFVNETPTLIEMIVPSNPAVWAGVWALRGNEAGR